MLPASSAEYQDSKGHEEKVVLLATSHLIIDNKITRSNKISFSHKSQLAYWLLAYRRSSAPEASALSALVHSITTQSQGIMEACDQGVFMGSSPPYRILEESESPATRAPM